MTNNIYIVKYLPDDILAHGPVYGRRVFALQPINGRIKNIKMSARNMFQEQVVELRSLLRQRFALLRSEQLGHLGVGARRKAVGGAADRGLSEKWNRHGNGQ